MDEHELKVWPMYFHYLVSGEKTFELRLGDRNIEAGDLLVLREYERGEYTGRYLERLVTYDLNFFPSSLDAFGWTSTDVARHGLQILSLKGGR